MLPMSLPPPTPPVCRVLHPQRWQEKCTDLQTAAAEAQAGQAALTVRPSSLAFIPGAICACSCFSLDMCDGGQLRCDAA